MVLGLTTSFTGKPDLRIPGPATSGLGTTSWLTGLAMGRGFPRTAEESNPADQPGEDDGGEEESAVAQEAEATALVAEAARALQEARQAVRRVQAARGYFPLGGKKGSLPKGAKGGGKTTGFSRAKESFLESPLVKKAAPASFVGGQGISFEIAPLGSPRARPTREAPRAVGCMPSQCTPTFFWNASNDDFPLEQPTLPAQHVPLDMILRKPFEADDSFGVGRDWEKVPLKPVLPYLAGGNRPQNGEPEDEHAVVMSRASCLTRESPKTQLA